MENLFKQQIYDEYDKNAALEFKIYEKLESFRTFRINISDAETDIKNAMYDFSTNFFIETMDEKNLKEQRKKFDTFCTIYKDLSETEIEFKNAMQQFKDTTEQICKKLSI